jgi:hypothetical protein
MFYSNPEIRRIIYEECVPPVVLICCGYYLGYRNGRDYEQRKQERRSDLQSRL